MHIEEIIAKVKPTDKKAAQLVQGRFDALIKPVGSLAKLETMTTRYAAITSKYTKEELTYPAQGLLVWSDFAHADYVEKIMRHQTPLNILAESTQARIYPLVVMSETEADAYEEGMNLLQEYALGDKLQLVAFGCLATEDELVETAMAGAMLQAAAMGIGIVLDGVATCRAAAKACELQPLVKEYLFAGHVSAEAESQQALEQLDLEAALRLNIPDGAGEGALVAFTLLKAGLKAYKEMETFEEAGVQIEMKEFSRKEEMHASHWQQQ